MESKDVYKETMLSDQQISNLGAQKVFFGHQSVGENIIQGIRDLGIQNPRLKLNIVASDSPEKIAGPAFVESHIGKNEEPRTKDKAFHEIIDKGLGSQGGIAMYKYCYIDINHGTDVQRMFDHYRSNIADLKQKYPKLKIIHVTVPLTTVEVTIKSWVKTILGRDASREANYKRNLFNKLLRQSYANTDPIYDLADIESTHTDGSRSFFMRGNDKIFTLVPEFTTDGGHLNEIGRRIAADRLLLLIAAMQ